MDQFSLAVFQYTEFYRPLVHKRRLQ